jgi:Leucine-rich repeat (LRR) protein
VTRHDGTGAAPVRHLAIPGPTSPSRENDHMRTLLLSLFLLACSFAPVRADDLGDRSKTVRTALERALNKKAADITAADLAGLKELELPHIHIPNFKENDFAGLTKLKKLHFYSLFHKQGKANEVVAFDKKVLAKLSGLEELIIEDDELGLLPDDAFAGLTSLKVLELTGSTLSRLPKSMLELPKIEAIYYDGEGMNKEDYATLKKALGDKLKPRREKK